MVKYKLIDGEYYTGTAKFKDGTVFPFRVTRVDIAQFMIDHRQARATIEDNPDRLVANYVALAERVHNKEVRLRRKAEREAQGIPPIRGGKRPNSGRKPKGITENLRFSWRVSRDVWDILQMQENKTEYIEEAIRFYHSREER